MRTKGQDNDPCNAAKSAINIRAIVDLAHELNGRSRPIQTVMDLGCGDGAGVYNFRRLGYKAYGLDLRQIWGPHRDKLERESLIDSGEEPFVRLDSVDGDFPFPDQSFDLVFSQQVLEHVQDYSHVFRQIHRVLRPEALSIHIVPSKYRPVEPHVYVPLGGIFQGYPYVAFWARFGFYRRNFWFRSCTASEAGQKTFEYLRDQTNYLDTSEIRHIAERYFQSTTFCEGAFLRHYVKHRFPTSPRAVQRLVSFPGLDVMVRTFHSRVLVLRKSARSWIATQARLRGFDP